MQVFVRPKNIHYHAHRAYSHGSCNLKLRGARESTWIDRNRKPTLTLTLECRRRHNLAFGWQRTSVWKRTTINDFSPILLWWYTSCLLVMECFDSSWVCSLFLEKTWSLCHKQKIWLSSVFWQFQIFCLLSCDVASSAKPCRVVLVDRLMYNMLNQCH